MNGSQLYEEWTNCSEEMQELAKTFSPKERLRLKALAQFVAHKHHKEILQLKQSHERLEHQLMVRHND